MQQFCPCGNALEYSACCQRYLSGAQPAPTPSHLMRSRYTAFVKKNADYLIATWHPDCNPQALRAELEQGFAGTEWLGLTIFSAEPGQHENEGFVSFVARYRDGQKSGAIIERSRFLKENEQWYYIDGTRPAIGRNDACPCGSGKKFKKCCGQ
ncbi:YchJ family protein [uncultured Pluralibacter sp.]|uniref:YchJ family protein n=1 Tax=uncultured Pluralibacter sp. TaxID=1490864 RepID=UPI0026200B24|nr:YchJ family protein [uncultured Pluralibacter sp.]